MSEKHLIEGLTYGTAQLVEWGVLPAEVLREGGQPGWSTVTRIDRHNCVVELDRAPRNDYPAFAVCKCDRVWPVKWVDAPPSVQPPGVMEALVDFGCDVCEPNFRDYLLPVVRGTTGRTPEGEGE